MRMHLTLKGNSWIWLGVALAGGCVARAADVPKPTEAMSSAVANFDFEKGLEGWTDKDTLSMSSTLAEAAHGGKLGLRINDQDAKLGSGLLSAPAPALPNAQYELSFWAKTLVKNGVGIWVRFYDAGHHTLNTAPTVVAALQNTTGEWKQYKTTLATPDKTASLAFWIHTYSGAQGAFDFDDFAVTPTGETVTPVPVVMPLPITRKTPAYVMIKVDDLIAEKGEVNPRWQKLVDFAKARNIKIGIGIIANSLEADNPRYINWIKAQHDSGRVEFWNHGFDHKQWMEDGKQLQEFKGSSYDLQKQHLQRSDALAREKLGFPFRAFGAPYNATDTNTSKVLEQEPDIQTWLYGDLKTPAGKVVLDRVPSVNIEVQVGKPDALKFAEGYNALPNRDFFVIQGHPAQWSNEGFEQFVQIVDFLTKAGAIFTTPSEYARLKHPALVK